MATKESISDSNIRKLQKIVQKNGIEVRRENLTRGLAFKVKSGVCQFSGKPLLFIDKRLSNEQQASVLVDYLLDLKLEVKDPDIDELPATITRLFSRQDLN